MTNSDSEESTCSGKRNTMSSSLYRLSKWKNVGGQLEKPAELFRKDLISAMKMPDSEVLFSEDYILISDTWRQDWEKGVQVPVNPESEKHCQVEPKKLLHAVADDKYKQSIHELHETHKLQEEVCRYDLDDLDEVWLKNYNITRENCGQDELSGWVMEKIIEELETRCYTSLKAAEAEGKEYDEDTVCDVCRMPDVEEGNEMVFCDGCDVGVHQACYGILKIPKGSWVCRTCALGIKPRCALCTTVGGAMKSTKGGGQWCHLSCAIWIPEVTIEDPEKMEPVCNIDLVPMTRWNLICCVCRERSGVCVQCCERKCKTAFHVTCAFKKNFQMKINCEETDLQFRGYCDEHSNNNLFGTPTRKISGERKTLEKSRLQSLREEFYLHVKQEEIARDLLLDVETISFVYEYWKLKRKSNFDKPLLTPKIEEAALLLEQNENSLGASLRRFIHLRQDLERVRNLCYMVLKREKTRLQYQMVKWDLFKMQEEKLEELKPGSKDYEFTRKVHRQNISIYERHEDIARAAACYGEVLQREAKDGCNDDEDHRTPEDRSTHIPAIPIEAICKTPKSKVKGNVATPSPAPRGRPPSSVKGKKRTPSVDPTENPYVKPTYKSFSWMLGSRKKRKRDDSTVGTNEGGEGHALVMSASDPVCSSGHEEVTKVEATGTQSLTDLKSPEMEFKPAASKVEEEKEDAKCKTSPAESRCLDDAMTSPSKSSLVACAGTTDVMPDPLNEADVKPGICESVDPSATVSGDIKRVKQKRNRQKSTANHKVDQRLRRRPRNEEEGGELRDEIRKADSSSSPLLSPLRSFCVPDSDIDDPICESINIKPQSDENLKKTDISSGKGEVKKVESLLNVSDDVLTLDIKEPKVCRDALFSPLKGSNRKKNCGTSDKTGESLPLNGDAVLQKPRNAQKMSKKRSSRLSSGDDMLSPKRPRRNGPTKDSNGSLVQSKISLSPLFKSKSPLSISVNVDDGIHLASPKNADKKKCKNPSNAFVDGKSKKDEVNNDDDDFEDPPKFKHSTLKMFNRKNVTPIIKSFQATLDHYLKSKDETKTKRAPSPEKNPEAPNSVARENGMAIDQTMKRVVLKLDRINSSMEKVSPQKFPHPPDKKTLKSSSNLPRRKVAEPEKREESRQKYVTRNSAGGARN